MMHTVKLFFDLGHTALALRLRTRQMRLVSIKVPEHGQHAAIAEQGKGVGLVTPLAAQLARQQRT